MTVRLVLLLVILVGCDDSQRASGWIDIDPERRLAEPSGIVYHAGRGTLYVVGDEGMIAEIDTGGALLQRSQLDGVDFEGITYDPATGTLYGGVEGDEKILALDPGNLQLHARFTLPRSIRGKLALVPGGGGIEALTFVPDTSRVQGGTFIVASQEKSAAVSTLYSVELPRHEASGAVQVDQLATTGIDDVAGLHYAPDQRRLYAVSDREDLLVVFTLDGDEVAAYPLTGSDQEGVTVDQDGTFYVAQDDGGILKGRPF